MTPLLRGLAYATPLAAVCWVLIGAVVFWAVS